MTRGRASALPWGALVLVVASGHLTLFPRVADLDAFYHLGHAAAYVEGSVLDTSLPWATQSVIGDRGGDLWWGFHVLLTPFAAFEDPAAGIRAAAVLLTTLLGLTVLWVLRRHEVPGAVWWAAGFLVAVPNVFFRYLMVRPHVLSLGASIALLSVLVRGRWWQVVVLSALISWLHLSLFWVAPGLAVAYAIARIPITIGTEPSGPDRGVELGAAVASAVAGTLIGWLLRPEPLATASLLNVQLVALFAQKATGAPLPFAPELAPIGVAELLRTSWLFAAAWVGGLALTARGALRSAPHRLDGERATLLVAATLVSIAFLGLALLSARRAMVQWVAFGFVTLPFAWSLTGAPGRRRWVLPVAAVLLAAHLAWGAWRHSLNVELVAFPGDALAEAAEFLESNSAPGDVVFHARWDNFGPLFARNRTNHYLGGMDPIFLLAHEPASYWEFFYLSADLNVEWTCDAFPCAEGSMTDSYLVLRDHFDARWVLVEPRRNPRLSLHLLNDPRFELALETPREAVFEIVDESRRGGG